MANGFFSVQGNQLPTATGGRVPLGPYNIPFGSVISAQTIALTAGTDTIPVPAGALGVCIQPPLGSPPTGVTLKVKTVLADSGIFISTEEPTFIEFDSVNSEVPADVYLVASGNITVVVQFL